MRLQLEGSTSEMHCTAGVEGAEVRVDGEKFTRVRAWAEGGSLPASPVGLISLDVEREKERLTLSAHYGVEGNLLRISGLKAEAPGVSLAGDIEYRFSSSILTGNLHGQFTDLMAAGRFAGIDLKGAGRFEVRFLEPEGRQKVVVQALLRDFGGSFGKMENVSLSADVLDPGGNPRGKAQLAVDGFKREGLSVDALSLDSAGDGGGVTVAAKARGTAGHPFALQGDGTVVPGRDETLLTLKKVNGRLGKYPLVMKKPWVISRKGDRFQAASLEMQFGEARARLEGNLDAEKINLSGKMEGFPLEMLTLFGVPHKTGRGSATLRIVGDISRPSGESHVQLTDVRSSVSEWGHVPPFTVQADGKMEGGRLSVRAELLGLTPHPARLELSVPAALSLRPMGFSIHDKGPLRGRLDAEGDLQSLVALFPQEEHKLNGYFQVGFTAAGSLSAPEISGKLAVDEGHYENWEYGMVLNQIHMRLTAVGNRLEMDVFRGTDGGKGRVEAVGRVHLDREKSFPFDFSATISDAQLVRGDNFTARIRGGPGFERVLERCVNEGRSHCGPIRSELGQNAPSCRG